MEDTLTDRNEEEEQARNDERDEWIASPSDDEVPFHIPRD